MECVGLLSISLDDCSMAQTSPNELIKTVETVENCLQSAGTKKSLNFSLTLFKNKDKL